MSRLGFSINSKDQISDSQKSYGFGYPADGTAGTMHVLICQVDGPVP